MSRMPANYQAREKEAVFAIKTGMHEVQGLPKWSPVRASAISTHAVYVLLTHSEEDDSGITRNARLCFCPRDQTMQVAVFAQDRDTPSPARFVAEFAKFDVYSAVNRFFALVDRIGEIGFLESATFLRETERA